VNIINEIYEVISMKTALLSTASPEFCIAIKKGIISCKKQYSKVSIKRYRHFVVYHLVLFGCLTK
jgi:hypothetical protein